MIYSEIFTTNLPCKERYLNPPTVKRIPNYEYYRKDSDNTEIFMDPLGRKVFIKTDKKEIFPLEAPIQVDFEVTQECNLDCKHCFVLEKKEVFSAKTWTTLTKLIRAGVLAIELTGGEAFLVKDIFKMIKYIKKHNRMVSISTNGTLISEKIAERLSIDPPHKIYVSLDGPKEVHEQIRGNGSFDAACSGIKNLNKYRIRPLISFTVSKFNIHTLPRLIKELKNRKLRILGLFLIFLEPSNTHKSFTKYCFKHSERERVAETINQMNLDAPKIIMHFSPRKINALYYGCFFRLTMCQVTPSGNVLACPILGECEGNLLKEDFRDIWKRIYNKLQEKNEDRCRNCRYNTRCFPCLYDFI